MNYKYLLLFSILILGINVHAQIICKNVKFRETTDTSLTSSFLTIGVLPDASAYSNWDFGDGSTYSYSGIKKKITHTYATAGIYQVCYEVILLDNVGDTACTKTYCANIAAGHIYNTGCTLDLYVPDTTYDFNGQATDSSAVYTSPVNLVAFQFLSSEGNIINFSASGTNYNQHSPGNSWSFTYWSEGLKEISSYRQFRDTSGNILCEDWATKYVYAKGAFPVQASFNKQPSSKPGTWDLFSTSVAAGFNPLNHKKEYGWKIEGIYYNSMNLQHSFRRPGQHIIRHYLAIIDKSSSSRIASDEVFDTIQVASAAYCEADFNLKEDYNNSRLFDFENRSINLYGSGTHSEFIWDFGDGNGSTKETPDDHLYASPGLYQVKLIHIVKDSLGQVLCSDTLVKPTKVCKTDFEVVVNAEDSYYYFKNNSSWGATNVTPQFEWDLGDGTKSNSWSVFHEYKQAGTYQVSLITSWLDSNNVVLCVDTASQLLEVFCQSSFSVDTSSSSQGNLNVYNTSLPNSSQTAYNTTYTWYFGDGDSSTSAFPTHYYAQAGLYQLCLRVISVDSSQNVCTMTYCDSIGMDSAGNFIYKKSSGGFTLNVLDPNSIGIVPHHTTPVKIYPNPASSEVNITGLPAEAEWRLLMLSGAEVSNGRVLVRDMNGKIPLPSLPDGIYILQIQNEGSVENFKLQILN